MLPNLPGTCTFKLKANSFLLDFQVVHVELAGSNASKYKNRDEDDGKMSTLTTILVAVAGAFGFFLMMLACCCVSKPVNWCTSSRKLRIPF